MFVPIILRTGKVTMMIDKLGSLDPIKQYNKTGKIDRPNEIKAKDSIEVSAEARAKSEVFMATEAARAAPDVRIDLVDAVKLKIQNPDYINDAILTAVAEGILKNLGI